MDVLDGIEKFADRVGKLFGSKGWVIKAFVMFACVLVCGGLIVIGALAKKDSK
ncbi:MAG: hypothetical protein PHF86_04845 [Candidatus Nanoarchaeia archaeon]|jgi:hypothetical protein|nr:hypothetical protein [Candidatus Nanoarchaeia archaeon]